MGSMLLLRQRKGLMSGLGGCQYRQSQKEPHRSTDNGAEGSDVRTATMQQMSSHDDGEGEEVRWWWRPSECSSRKPLSRNPTRSSIHSLTSRIDGGRLWQPNLQESGIITQERRKLDVHRDWPGAGVRFANQVRRLSCSCA